MLLVAFGTRPEWIKIRPLINEIKGAIPYRLLFTGQHTDIVDSSLNNYEYRTLSINQTMSSNRLDSIVCSIMSDIDDHLEGVTHVMVQGDTTTVFGVALACFHRGVKVIHLEAGLRTWDNKQPYPEEFNRQAVSSIADIHLCPTKSSMKNLISEGRHHNSEVYVVGNTVLDNLRNQLPNQDYQVLVTLHRRENHKNIAEWFSVINKIAEENTDLFFVLPIHPNPNVLEHKDILTNVEVCDPLPHHYLLKHLKDSRLVITDSGGIQEEAAYFHKPCIVCREKTERLEGVNEFSWLCKTPSDLINIFNKLKNRKIDQSLPCPYGDGFASTKIKQILNGEFRHSKQVL
jgi:UDP-N-acetylglucosamine 2-epimerase (non-hydrolysing)